MQCKYEHKADNTHEICSYTKYSRMNTIACKNLNMRLSVWANIDVSLIFWVFSFICKITISPWMPCLIHGTEVNKYKIYNIIQEVKFKITLILMLNHFSYYWSSSFQKVYSRSTISLLIWGYAKAVWSVHNALELH